MLHADALHTVSGSACLAISPDAACAWEQSAVQVSQRKAVRNSRMEHVFLGILGVNASPLKERSQHPFYLLSLFPLKPDPLCQSFIRQYELVWQCWSSCFLYDLGAGITTLGYLSNGF